MNSLHKLLGGLRMLSDVDLWRIIMSEVGHPLYTPGRTPKSIGKIPPVSVLEVDEAAGLHLLSIAGCHYWVPRSVLADTLPALYSEVFCESHPHYYEYKDCYIRPGDIVVDAGACEGFFTRFALGRGANVIAIEPWGPMADGLRRTFATEIATGSVRVVQAALSDRIGTVSLHIDPVAPWGASITNTTIGNTVSIVSQTTLDELLAGGRCDFLKMDIEGAEVKAIAGAHECLARDHPCLSIAIYHHASGYTDIRHYLLSLNLQYNITGKGLQRSVLLFPTILHAW